MGTFQSAVTFQKGILTNGAPLPGQDYISGLIFYDNSLPTNWPAGLIKECFSPQDAINSGLDGLGADATKSTMTYVVTHGASGAGDTVTIYVQEPINPLNTALNPNKVTLAAYTTVAGDTLIATLVTALTAAINQNTYLTGYTAVESLSTTITITARAGLGVFLNTGSPYSVVITGATVTGTITQNVVPGVASQWDIFYYHISEFFRINANGILWVGIFATGSNAFAELTTLQQAASGSLRQVGIYRPDRAIVTYSATDIATINTVAQTLDNNKMPLSTVLVEDMAALSGVSGLATLTNLAGLNSEWVSVNISQDGAAQGWALYKAYGKTIGNLGAILGTISAAAVSADIAQPIPSNNISNGTENELPAFGNNTLFSAVTPTLQTQLDNFRYIYTGTYVGYVGTYFSESHCAIIQNSNYAYIEQNRVQAKIERSLYQAYLPYLKSQLSLNSDGTLTALLVSALQSVGDNALAPMVQAGELSAVSTQISPTQNITTQGGLVVTVNEINNPIARKITITTNSVTTLP